MQVNRSLETEKMKRKVAQHGHGQDSSEVERHVMGNRVVTIRMFAVLLLPRQETYLESLATMGDSYHARIAEAGHRSVALSQVQRAGRRVLLDSGAQGLAARGEGHLAMA
jgi:hypothetical protein